MKNNIKSISIIIGTMIGAGFASGKEVYIFFVKYGVAGILGAVISTIMTATIIYMTIKISKHCEVESNNQFVDLISKNKTVSSIVKKIINTFLLASFWIMCAGLCSFFKQEFKIPIIITAIISGTIIYIILMKNIEGIVKLNSIIVPIMIIAIIAIGIKNSTPTIKIQPESEVLPSIVKAILYTSYNSIILIPIIVSISKNIKHEKNVKIISFISSIIILTMLILIYQMLLSTNMDISKVEMPILAILSGKIDKVMYGVSIITAIITSVISAGYGALENIKNKNEYKMAVLAICVLEIPISYIGFGNLVTVLYPVFGAIGIIQIILVIKSYCKNCKKLI